MMAPVVDEQQLISLPACTCSYHELDRNLMQIPVVPYLSNGLNMLNRELQDTVCYYLDHSMKIDAIFLEFLISPYIIDDYVRKNFVRDIWRIMLKKQNVHGTPVEGGLYCQFHGIKPLLFLVSNHG